MHSPHPRPLSTHATFSPCHLPPPPPFPPLSCPNADLIGDSAVILAKERIVPDVIENISDKAAFKVCLIVLRGLPAQHQQNNSSRVERRSMRAFRVQLPAP
jgi:hypothetical protein